MALVVKMVAIGMVVSVMLAVTLAVVGGEEAQAGQDADMTARTAQAVWYHVSNDKYGEIEHALTAHGSDRAATIMVHVANRECDGVLYEDFSCSTGK